MTTRTDSQPTCDRCFFRLAALCALPGNTPCPTYRPARSADRQEHAAHTERRSRRRTPAVA